VQGNPRRIGDRLAECATAVLGEALVGVFLHGSGTTDDFVPDLSDIDVLVITEGSIDDPTASDLLERVARTGREARTNVDLRVATRVSAAATEKAPELELGSRCGSDGPRMRGSRPAEGPERDLLVEYSVCRQHGLALVGPDPAVLIGEVPTAWVLEVGAAQLRDWQWTTSRSTGT
jgi:predicted nucleotidyltransferase